MFDQIGEALTEILKKDISDILFKPGQIGVYLPYDHGEVVLGLYLYSIRNCAELDSPTVAARGRNVKAIPPRFVSLYYIVTAYSNAELPYRALDEHNILVRAMQAFEKTPVLTESVLGFKPGSWVDSLKLQFVDVEATEISNIWGSRDSPYRLSVVYRVFPVEISVQRGSIARRISEVDSSLNSKV